MTTPTAEEWTDEYVRDLITQGGAALVADAHNAEVAAAYEAGFEKGVGRINVIHNDAPELRAELADEQDLRERAGEQAETLAEYLVDAKADLSVAQEQLADEREKAQRLTKFADQLQGQLAAERKDHYKIHTELASVEMHRDATLEQLAAAVEALKELRKRVLTKEQYAIVEEALVTIKYPVTIAKLEGK